VRESKTAKALGKREGLGRYKRFASPSYSNQGCLFGSIGLPMFVGGCDWCIADWHGEGWPSRILYAAGLLMGLSFLAIAFEPAFGRRAGSSRPRLYCFEDGVVVATGRRLRAYRWTELTIRRKKSQTGAGENYDYGTSVTIESTADGTMLAYFPGNEPERAGAYEVCGLHDAASGRDSSEADSTTPDPEEDPRPLGSPGG
jgi:hypothetical protein